MMKVIFLFFCLFARFPGRSKKNKKKNNEDESKSLHLEGLKKHKIFLFVLDFLEQENTVKHMLLNQITSVQSGL